MTTETLMDSRTSQLVTKNRHYTSAYALHEQEILAVDSPRLVNVDDIHAERVVAAACRGLAKLRPKLLALGGDLRLDKIDALPTLVAAFVCAGARCVQLKHDKAQWMRLHQEALALRRSLVKAKAAMLSLGLPLADNMRAMVMGTGYDQLARDLLLLHSFFADQPEALGQVPLPRALIERAAVLAQELIGVSELRDANALSVSDAHRVRRQAFALLTAAYKEASAAVHYLRRDFGDAEQFVPLLFRPKTPRSARKKKQVVPPVEAAQAPATQAELPEQTSPLLVRQRHEPGES